MVLKKDKDLGQNKNEMNKGLHWELLVVVYTACAGHFAAWGCVLTETRCRQLAWNWDGRVNRHAVLALGGPAAVWHPYGTL